MEEHVDKRNKKHGPTTHSGRMTNKNNNEDENNNQYTIKSK